MTEKARPSLERVEWSDHTSLSAGWVPVEDVNALKPSRILTVGWIVCEDENSVTVASCRDVSNEKYDSIICIIKTNIIKRRKLREPA